MKNKEFHLGMSDEETLDALFADLTPISDEEFNRREKIAKEISDILGEESKLKKYKIDIFAVSEAKVDFSKKTIEWLENALENAKNRISNSENKEEIEDTISYIKVIWKELQERK